MMLFSSTRQYAMNWISQIFNYSVTISFFTILMSLQMKFFDVHIKPLATGDTIDDVVQIFGILPMFVTVTMLFVIVAFNIPSIASALTGGAGAGGFSTMVNFVRQALNGGKHSSPLTGSGLGAIDNSKKEAKDLRYCFHTTILNLCHVPKHAYK
ncbi:type IV secretion system protein [Kingella kingae]|uniref:type IV secretion system protein n=1 Tax=Kingella kingae TaxID=504 RepID=UPI0032B5EC2A